ncbi:MAG: hypothetical protein KGH64_01265 [Candidatus Micrarchaeota archaeon]|nr:hypothetical protein [Candidatus Micrarchaeota archaeon]MDE1833947.1 hypothetical protein [Candidatus Micrarchaeota archaeon]MDE1859823.1 hypothetical protein [Candidatus Micrarchaeota archaeon]
MQQLRIIVDNRERNFEILDALAGSGVNLSFAQLPVGDYVVSDRICVERKTVRDFESSIMDNRLFEQLERLKAGFEKPILILEGQESDHLLSENVITGTIVKLYADYNVQMIRARDPVGTAAILSKFADREQNGEKKEPRILGIKKAHTTYQWQILLLSSLPGIGPNLARKLLEHFRTLRGVMTADAKSLMEVDKIGRKKADEIYRVLNAEFSVDGI